MKVSRGEVRHFANCVPYTCPMVSYINKNDKNVTIPNLKKKMKLVEKKPRKKERSGKKETKTERKVGKVKKKTRQKERSGKQKNKAERKVGKVRNRGRKNDRKKKSRKKERSGKKESKQERKNERNRMFWGYTVQHLAG